MTPDDCPGACWNGDCDVCRAWGTELDDTQEFEAVTDVDAD